MAAVAIAGHGSAGTHAGKARHCKTTDESCASDLYARDGNRCLQELRTTVWHTHLTAFAMRS